MNLRIAGLDTDADLFDDDLDAVAATLLATIHAKLLEKCAIGDR